jgi:hypothetical protein
MENEWDKIYTTTMEKLDRYSKIWNFNLKGLTMEDVFNNRYKMWIQQVDIWAEQHGITRKQAISILSENYFKNKITMKELLSWTEVDDFIFKYKESTND